jgi:glutaredoxin/glutathione-dependent peroxiredoxin
VDKAETLKGQGVDLIACLSVNDAFVMKAWGESQAVGEDIMMLADGSGDFTRAVGLTMDAKKFGMGERSQRYSMIVEDGVVKSLNVEEPGEFRVSSAEYLVDQLGG